MKKKGIFIVIEGVDGSGKSTVVNKLYHILKNNKNYNNILLTGEPCNKFIKNEYMNNEKYDKKFLRNLFLFDRIIHCMYMKYCMKKGYIIICDRYKYSTYVYQSSSIDEVESLIKLHNRFKIPDPDYLFILNCEAEICLERIEKRGEDKDKTSVVTEVDTRSRVYNFENLEKIKLHQERYMELYEKIKNENQIIYIINNNNYEAIDIIIPKLQI